MARPSTFRLFFCALITCPLVAQTSPGTNVAAPGYDALAQASGAISSPLTQPTLTPGALLLLELEGRFAKAVETGGGKAFGASFAADGITLNHSKPAGLGPTPIAPLAPSDPQTHQPTLVPHGAQIGPSDATG